MTQHPVAFISHSECDDPFCHALYDALLARGIRPIMDKRDFRPGDDLVKRVFDEGIGASDAVIFVLSPRSVDRPWVREELSVGVVRKLAQQTRLIPVLVDGLPDDLVPTALSATIWIRVDERKTADIVAAEIATAVHADGRPNPTIAPPPAWTQRAVAGIRGLEARDEVVFAFMCEQRLGIDHPFVSTQEVHDFARSQGITDEDFDAMLSVFERHGFLGKSITEMGSRLPVALNPSRYALDVYLQAYLAQEYDEWFTAVVAALVNDRAGDLDGLAQVVAAPRPVLEHIIGVLESQGELRAIRALGGYVGWHVNPSLRRRLR